jgi:hypothetical protein
MNQNPYFMAQEFVRKNFGTSSRSAMAKAILSIYNQDHSFSIGEILGPLDRENSAVVVAMLIEYAKHGETAELRQAGEFVCKNFPRLLELSDAMQEARYAVHRNWRRQDEEERQF